MKSDARPFRELEPNEGHPVHAVSWSPTGDAFLVVTGAAQPKVCVSRVCVCVCVCCSVMCFGV